MGREPPVGNVFGEPNRILVASRVAKRGNLDKTLKLGSLRCLWVEDDQNDAMAVDQWLLKATLQHLRRGSLSKQSSA